MVNKLFKVVSKAVTVAAVASTTYDLYQKGKVAYKAYKGTKKVKSHVSKAATTVSNIVKAIKK